MYATTRPSLQKQWKKSVLSPKPTAELKVVSKGGEVVNQWDLELDSILKSPRKVKGKFHTPKIDKDNEFIENEAIQNAIPDFMHLPILHDFHKERTVGIVTKVVELADGSFDFEGLIKATDDCKDIWDLIAGGKYDQVSIFGKRTGGSASCNLKPEQRTTPCTTTGVRLDSISVCDDNARNDGTFLAIAKSKVVFEATDSIIKAETTSSSLMHTKTDGDECPCKKRKIPTMNFVDYDPTKDVSSPHYIDPNKEPESPNRIYSVAGSHLQRPFKKAEETNVTGSMQKLIDQLTEKITEMVEFDTEKKAEGRVWNNPKRFAPSTKPKGEKPSRAVTLDEPNRAGTTKTEDLTPEQKEQRAAKLEENRKRPLPAKRSYKDKYDFEGDRNKKFYSPDKEPVRGNTKPSYEQPSDRTEVDRAIQSRAEGTNRPSGNRAEGNTDKPPGKKPHLEGSKYQGQDADKEGRGYTEAGEKIVPDSSSRPQKVGGKDSELPERKEPENTGEKYPDNPKRPKKEAKPKEHGSERPPIDNPTPPPTNEEGWEKTRSAPEKRTGIRFGGSGLKDSERQKVPGSTERVRIKVPKEEGETSPEPQSQATGDVEPETPQETEFASRGEEAGGAHDEPEAFNDEDKAGDEPDYSEGEPAEVEMDEPEEQEGIYSSLKRLGEAISKLTASDEKVHEEFEEEEEELEEYEEGEEPETAEGLGGFEKKATAKDQKCSIKKSRGTEDMNDDEVNTIVKAKVDEITKAYKAELDELKTRIEKMESETISKSGVVAILREGDPDVGEVAMTNAGAVASMGKKAKV